MADEPKTLRQEIYYTPEKVAELRKCVKQTVYRHLNDPDYPYLKNARVIGKRGWIIPKSDVVEYLGEDPDEVEIKIVDVKS